MDSNILEKNVHELNGAINHVISIQTNLVQRIKNLELIGHGVDGSPTTSLQNHTNGGSEIAVSDDLQQSFLNIKDTLSKYKLPNNLKLNVESRAGIKDSSRLNTVIRCARYTETLLKILLQLLQCKLY